PRRAREPVRGVERRAQRGVPLPPQPRPAAGPAAGADRLHRGAPAGKHPLADGGLVCWIRSSPADGTPPERTSDPESTRENEYLASVLIDSEVRPTPPLRLANLG